MSSTDLTSNIARLLSDRNEAWGLLQGEHVLYRYESGAGHLILKCDAIDIPGIIPDFEVLLVWAREHGVDFVAWLAVDALGFVHISGPGKVPHPVDLVQGHFIRGFEFRLVKPA